LVSLKSDSKQGVAIVKSVNKDGKKVIEEKKYLTPEKHGAIKVDSFNAFNLIVKAEDGYIWIFNPFDGIRTVPLLADEKAYSATTSEL